jgi:hypothetical protein
MQLRVNIKTWIQLFPNQFTSESVIHCYMLIYLFIKEKNEQKDNTTSDHQNTYQINSNLKNKGELLVKIFVPYIHSLYSEIIK